MESVADGGLTDGGAAQGGGGLTPLQSHSTGEIPNKKSSWLDVS